MRNVSKYYMEYYGKKINIIDDSVYNCNYNIEDHISDKLKLTFNFDTECKNKQELPIFKKTILVLSGGGIKGICHIGALQAICDKSMLNQITTFAGSSVGALIATLLVIGYEPHDLYDFITLFDINKLKSFNLGSSITDLVNNYGIDHGTNIEIVITKMFNLKNIKSNVTFHELHKLTNKTLYITSSCINTKEICYYSHIQTPDMTVITALRMSISIPILFTPVKFNGNLYIDGGCIDNFPIKLFDNVLDNVIGIYLGETYETQLISNIEDFVLNTIMCLFEGTNKNTIRGYEKYSVIIKTNCVNALNFSIDNNVKEQLYKIGYDVTNQYLDSF